MSNAQQTLEAFLQSNNWQVEKGEGNSIYRLTMPAGDRQLISYAILYSTHFMFYPMAPFPVPAEQYAAVAEYTARVNENLWTHNFELDYQSGQIRCKAGFAFRDMPLNTQLVENVIHNSVDAMLHFMPDMVAVAAGEKSAAEAAAEGSATQSGNSTENGDNQTYHNVVQQFFEEEGWPYEKHYDTVSSLMYSGHNRDSYFSYISMVPAQTNFYIDISLGALEETERKAKVIEWITTMNYNLRLGYFRYDFAQDFIFFTNGINFYEVMPDPNLLRNVVYPALTTADKYWPYLAKVIAGTASPQAAIPPSTANPSENAQH